MSNATAHIPTETLSAYSDGELGPEEMARVDDHVAECAKCALTLEELTHIRDLVRLLGRQPAPERFTGRVVGRIRRRSRGRFFHTRWQATAPYLAAAILLVILAALYFFSRVAFEVHDAESPGSGAPVQPDAGRGGDLDAGD